MKVKIQTAHFDDISLFGGVIPKEIKELIPLTYMFSENTVDKVIKLVLFYLKGQSTSGSNIEKVQQRVEEDAKKGIPDYIKLKRYIASIQESEKHGYFPVLFTGFYMILRAAIMKRMKASVFAEQATHFGFPETLAQLLGTIYEKRRNSLIQEAEKSSSWFNSIVDVRWRVDVAISSSAMTSIFKPYLLMQLQLSSGKIVMFETTIEQFHKLRLSTASLLNQMYQLSSTMIMNIQEA
mmetsp:Transcript_3765/g.5565  ORF Transcript_3765/g.5565 Transcript_3765/m.5565 type:complete len:237 (+) Transcript_3765:10-720(+)